MRYFNTVSAIAILFLGLESQQALSEDEFKMVPPPACTNNLGEQVEFMTSARGRSGIAAGMAVRNQEGKPVVYRSNFKSAPPEYQSFIDRHECAHHQTGDVDRPHPPRNGPEHLMNESVSDCIAILRLRDEEKYSAADLEKVTIAMRKEMEKIGFPEISVSSRISNTEGCLRKFKNSKELIDRILDERGLGKK
ncbi:MAG: hypothetical protein ACR2OJ_09620 [Hyphomicrobiales bacterium]